ncbi:MAG TPA: cellulosome anchor protein [Firmicutes bacterium]|nr:cellulosome anchor protein [Bacillota bacterium]
MKSYWKTGLILLAAIVIAGVGAESPEDSGIVEEAGEPSAVERLEQLDPNRLVLSNEYIAVAVNRSPDGTGRFGVKVTGGDPYRSGDEEQPLIYGFENPWTSYTTIQIDGKDYIFGGRTGKRSGGSGEFGQVIAGPELDEEKGVIRTVCRFDTVEVMQEIAVVESTTTLLPDTAKIQYTIINRDEKPREVGLRVVIDTMLGENDGNPFRIGETAIETDTVFPREELPEFWQAFDTLSNPRVIAQGTLKGREAIPPDYLYFTNWGTVADHHWDVPLVRGRDFTRAGEFELDSAAVYKWEPVTVAPVDTCTYVLYYGLGGVTVKPGELQLGVTSPAEIPLVATEKSYSIIAYIENTGAGPAMNARVRLNLPRGLVLTGRRPAESALGNIRPGEIKQVHWEIKPDGTVTGQLQFDVVVSAVNLPENRAVRNIRLIGPPKLTLTVKNPPPLKVVNEKLQPVPYPLAVTVKNTGESSAYRVTAGLQLGPGMEMAPGELRHKYVGQLKPGETYDLSWYLLPEATGSRTFQGIRVESETTAPEMRIVLIELPVLTPKVRVVPLRGRYQAGDYLAVEIRAEHIPMLNGASFDLIYDSQILQAERVERGVFFVEDGVLTTWQPGVIDRGKGVIREVMGERTTPGRTGAPLATVYFLIKDEPGEAVIKPENIRLWSNENKLPAYLVEGLVIKISRGGGVEIVPVQVD